MTGTTPIDVIIQGDCLEEMKKLQDKSVDMILCDLPYGTTACKWDHVIPFEPLWKEYKRLIKDRGAIVLTASQPFTSALVMSNTQMYRYSWVWLKTYTTGFMNANKMPLKSFEDVLVFYKNLPTFNPIGVRPINKKQHRTKDKDTTIYSDMGLKTGNYRQKLTDYPSDRIEICGKEETVHPTQKPVALFEYLIKTYTNEGDLVLDNCIGSGTTAVAAKRTGRHFIGIELSPEYCEIARKRVAAVPARLDRWAEAEG